MNALAWMLAALTVVICQQANALYTPQDAVRDALSDDLKLVGKWVPSYSESGKIPTCVYRGKKVVVYQSYCTKARISAFGTRIHSLDPNVGFVQIYAETKADDDIRKVKRDRYADILWYISARKSGSKFKFNGSASQMRAFDESLSKNPSPGCLTSRTFPITCKSEYAGEVKSWGNPAQEFWDQPTSGWYELINTMQARSLVELE